MPEISHEETRKLLEGIKIVRNIYHDNIILVTEVDTQDHYRALHDTFQRLCEAGP